MRSLIGELRWSLEHRGVSGTLRAAARWMGRTMRPKEQAAIHPFDMEHGTDTGGLITGGDLASGHASDRHIEGYAAVPPSRFRRMIGRWQASKPPHALAEYCFVDLGCGKGRALLVASELGFREVVGVELNPALAATAKANAELWTAADKARTTIRIEQKDALELRWPEGPCLVFMFNPFDAALMRRLMRRIAAEFLHRPSDLEVLYYKPEQADALPQEFAMVWCEAIDIDAEELAADPVADARDETRAYRLSASGK